MNLLVQLTRYFFDSAYYGHPLIATAGALAYLAGITGRRYNISRTGLNLYIIIVAKTGFGKDTAGRTISRLNTMLEHDEFTGPSHIASGQALQIALHEQRSFLSVVGEIGYLFQNITNPKAAEHQKSLQKLLLSLYTLSGAGHKLGKMRYADQKKNVPEVLSPAFSLLGDATRETFYTTLRRENILSGLYPRLSVFEMPDHEFPMIASTVNADINDYGILPRLKALTKACAPVVVSDDRIMYPDCVNIKIDDAATQLLNNFRDTCRKMIRDKEDEAVTSIISRSHMKALRYCGLLAVGDCQSFDTQTIPIVTKKHAQKAISIERYCTKKLISSALKEQVGLNNEPQRLDEIITFCREWVSELPDNKFKKYLKDERRKIVREFRSKKLIPWEAFYQRFRRSSLFAADTGSKPSQAIRSALTELEELERITQPAYEDGDRKLLSVPINSVLYKIISVESIDDDISLLE